MRSRFSILICCVMLWASLTLPGGVAVAGDPGGACNPDVRAGHAARLVSMSGSVAVYDEQGVPLGVGTGVVVPSGGRIETAPGASAELAFEDGTADRLSRFTVEGGSSLKITGGLYCSDLRPKADGGRWSAREIGIELLLGGLEIEVAPGVSHSFNLDVQTPNATARMVRGTVDRMAAEVRLSGVDDRPMVPVAEHPRIRNQISALTGGRDMDSLSSREREGVMAQAAMTALSLGLIDLEATGALDDPRINATMTGMTGGRKFEDLDDDERTMITRAMGGIAIQMGLVDIEGLQVYGEPDELTTVIVEAGRMRVHNRHRGWKRDEAVIVQEGMYTEVRGYDLPTGPDRLAD